MGNAEREREREPRCRNIQSQAERRDRGQTEKSWLLLEGAGTSLYDLMRKSGKILLIFFEIHQKMGVIFKRLIRQTVDFLAEAWTKKKKTFDVTSRFVMLDMRWKGLERAMNLSQVSAQGDAVFLASSRRENPTKPYLG